MSESKTLTIDKIMEYIEEHHGNFMIAETFGDCEFAITEFVPFEVAKVIIARTADACFSEAGEYLPEMKDFALRLFTIIGYTNVPIPEIGDQNLEALNDTYKILYLSGIYETVLRNIDWPQYEQIKNAIDEKIEYIKSTNVSGVKNELNKAMSGISAITDSLDSVFGDFSAEDIEKIASAIENNQIDEKKLMAAYLESK